METWLRENGFRLQVVYRKGGAYDAAARDIEGKLAQRFARRVNGARAAGPVHELCAANYAVHEITETARIGHMDVLSGDDAFQKALETLPAARPAPASARARAAAHEALDGPVLARLASYAGNRAVSRLLAARRRPRPSAGRPRRSRSRSAGTRPSRRRSTSRTRSPTIPSTGRRRSSSTTRASAAATARSRSSSSRTPSTTSRSCRPRPPRTSTTTRRRLKKKLGGDAATSTSSSPTTARTSTSPTRAGSTSASTR